VPLGEGDIEVGLLYHLPFTKGDRLCEDVMAIQDFHHYNKILRSRARALRKDMTKAEACLWKYVLRAGMMEGYGFNRQRPILNYIADFFCKRLSLVVEVDGMSHSAEGARLRDEIRQKALEGAGFKVVRFSDGDVLNNIEGVRKALELCIEEREKELGLSSPLPSQRGGHGRRLAVPSPPRRGG